jgi:hypothetical protein
VRLRAPESCPLAGKVKTRGDEIKVGRWEQARGIEQNSKTIAQLEQVTQRAAASAEAEKEAQRGRAATQTAMWRGL